MREITLKKKHVKIVDELLNGFDTTKFNQSPFSLSLRANIYVPVVGTTKQGKRIRFFFNGTVLCTQEEKSRLNNPEWVRAKKIQLKTTCEYQLKKLLTGNWTIVYVWPGENRNYRFNDIQLDWRMRDAIQLKK